MLFEIVHVLVGFSTDQKSMFAMRNATSLPVTPCKSSKTWRVT